MKTLLITTNILLLSAIGCSAQSKLTLVNDMQPPQHVTCRLFTLHNQNVVTLHDVGATVAHVPAGTYSFFGTQGGAIPCLNNSPQYTIDGHSDYTITIQNAGAPNNTAACIVTINAD